MFAHDKIFSPGMKSLGTDSGNALQGSTN